MERTVESYSTVRPVYSIDRDRVRLSGVWYWGWQSQTPRCTVLMETESDSMVSGIEDDRVRLCGVQFWWRQSPTPRWPVLMDTESDSAVYGVDGDKVRLHGVLYWWRQSQTPWCPVLMETKSDSAVSEINTETHSAVSDISSASGQSFFLFFIILRMKELFWKSERYEYWYNSYVLIFTVLAK